MVLLVSLVLVVVAGAGAVAAGERCRGTQKSFNGPFRMWGCSGVLPRAIAGGIGGSLSIALSYHTLTAANSSP